MNKIKIGKIIFERRSSLSITQEDLAEMSGITSKSIYLIESGTGNPSLESLGKICTVLGLEINVEVKKVEE